LPVLKSIAGRIAATAWMRNAMNNGDVQYVFREKPAMQVYRGIGLILISYVIGWPLVYGLSHLVF
jgi:hypothetical protein